MRLFEETQRQITALFQESKNYAMLQKQAFQKDLSWGLAQLLSALAVAFIVIFMLGIIAMFLCISLAFLIGRWLESTALGFAIMGAVFCLILTLVYLARRRLIINVVIRLVDQTIGRNSGDATREELAQQLVQSRQAMRRSVQQLTSSDSNGGFSLMRMTRWVSWSIAAYQGIRMGCSIIGSIGGLFLGRKRFR